jgi:hypothetical protein
MMKRDGRLDHRLEKQFLLGSNLAHPAFFPRIVRGVKFTRVIKVDPGDVFHWIRGYVRV